MPDGVAGTANALNGLQADAGAIGHLPRGRGKRFSQQTVKNCGLTGFRLG
jgi:hypothetical protein